jgi:mannosyltransferase OCH1-like enzyme
MKQKFRCFAFLVAFLMHTHFAVAAGIVYPNFKASMLREKPNQDRFDPKFLQREKIYEQRDAKFKKIFQDIYEKNSAAAKESWETSEARIPRIIHQIWLGTKPIPEMCLQWMETWTQLNGWKYKLWTDKEAAEIFMYNRDLYEASDNYGEKADILRLEILNQFGGIYADVDYECLRPDIFEELNRSYDFYIGFEPLEHGCVARFNMFQICNALIASCPQHPLLQDIVENLKANFYAYKNVAGCVHRTGPAYLTRIICSYEKSDAASQKHRNIYLPSTFFYAYSEPEVRAYFMGENISLEPFSETAGHHYWSGTWRPTHPLNQLGCFY